MRDLNKSTGKLKKKYITEYIQSKPTQDERIKDKSEDMRSIKDQKT